MAIVSHEATTHAKYKGHFDKLQMLKNESCASNLKDLGVYYEESIYE